MVGGLGTIEGAGVWGDATRGTQGLFRPPATAPDRPLPADTQGKWKRVVDASRLAVERA